MILKKPSSNLRVRTPWIQYGQTGGIKPPDWMNPTDLEIPTDIALTEI